MNRDRVASEKLLKSLEGEGFRAVFLTVDAAVPGKRELDQRAKGDFSVRKQQPACLTEYMLTVVPHIYRVPHMEDQRRGQV